jgi:phosphoribosylformimino-5-aminoimidazole carboxamide ribotide isomerase
VIASGGVSKIGDIQKLLDLKAQNLLGVITGKAIYEGTLNLKEAIDLCSPKE